MHTFQTAVCRKPELYIYQCGHQGTGRHVCRAGQKIFVEMGPVGGAAYGKHLPGAALSLQP